MNQNLFKPTYLQQLCKECGMRPSKKYGQNYLVSDNPIKRMIDAADVKKTDTVVEIGPGFGVLTFALLERGCRVVAFEIERKLEGYWSEVINDKLINDNFEIIWGNALNNLSLITPHLSSYKVVANLPYQITSNVLRTLLELENKPESITVMVQKEVADRIIAKPGDMSILTVSVQYYGEPKIITKVARGCFWPSPKVDSAVLHIKIKARKQESKKFDKRFFEIVKAGFANKRKQLWRNLAVGLKIEDQKIKDLLIRIVGSEKIRAEELSVEDWMKIAERS